MKITHALALGAISSLALSTFAFSTSALAQAPVAAAQPSPGPLIAGVCLYSNERAIATSAVGQSVVKRLKELAASADAELGAERSQLQTEQASFEAQRSSLSQDQMDQRALAFKQHVEAFQRKSQQRAQELQATQNKQLEVIAVQVDPLLKQVYTERNCGLLLNANAVYGGNPQMDVTQLVITKLNSKMTTLSFDREHLDQQAQAGVAPSQPTSVAPTSAAPRKKK
jgi:Skp family chaperone for outer membrane proteins